MEVGDEQLCLNGHGWVRDEQHRLRHCCQEGEGEDDGIGMSLSSSRG